VEIWDLRQQNLQHPKTNHIGIIRKLAIGLVTSFVKANSLLYSPAKSEEFRVPHLIRP